MFFFLTYAKETVTFDSSFLVLRIFRSRLSFKVTGSNLDAAKLQNGWHQWFVVGCVWFSLSINESPVVIPFSPVFGLPRPPVLAGGNQGPSLALHSNMSKTKKLREEANQKKAQIPMKKSQITVETNTNSHRKMSQIPMMVRCVFFPDSQFFFFHSCIIYSKKKATENSSG